MLSQFSLICYIKTIVISESYLQFAEPIIFDCIFFAFLTVLLNSTISCYIVYITYAYCMLYLKSLKTFIEYKAVDIGLHWKSIPAQ